MFITINKNTNKIETSEEFKGYIFNFLIRDSLRYSVMLSGSSYVECKERAEKFLKNLFSTNEIIFISLQHYNNLVLL